MSTISYEVSFTMTYADLTKRTYKFENVEDPDNTVLQNVKPKIRAINANTGDAYANIRNVFVSDDLQPLDRITAATITATEEEVIYNG